MFSGVESFFIVVQGYFTHRTYVSDHLQPEDEDWDKMSPRLTLIFQTCVDMEQIYVK